jgi:hypothetical protein
MGTGQRAWLSYRTQLTRRAESTNRLDRRKFLSAPPFAWALGHEGSAKVEFHPDLTRSDGLSFIAAALRRRISPVPECRGRSKGARRPCRAGRVQSAGRCRPEHTCRAKDQRRPTNLSAPRVTGQQISPGSTGRLKQCSNACTDHHAEGKNESRNDNMLRSPRRPLIRRARRNVHGPLA